MMVLTCLNACAQAEEIALEVESGKLSGTVLYPESEAPYPAVLIVAGSGPTDRDGNTGPYESNCLKMLAEGLADNGIASLRFDKRGIGKSQTELKESDYIFETMVEDARALLEYLDEENRVKSISVLGHSEGALIGAIISQSSEVEKFVSISGTGRPADEIISDQLAAQSPLAAAVGKSIMDSLKAGHRVTAVPPAFMSLFRPSIQPYMISWFKYDPAEVIAKLDKPVLVINGTNDIQVDENEARILDEASENSKLVLIEGMNHVLKDAPEERNANIAVYSDTDKPLSDGLVKSIVEFVKLDQGRE